MSECLNHIHQFQPWAYSIENAVEEGRFRYGAKYDTIFRKWGTINSVYDKFCDHKLFKVGNPKDGKFHYPADVSKQVTGYFKKLDISVKDKKKTRRLVELEPGTVLTPEAVVEDAVPAATLAVDKRAFKVYSTLFHSPDSPNQPGEIAWPDFLHAMVEAGFGAMKLQGSAWHFTPERSDVDRSIQFHEPHPGNKLPFTWARRYGRRLTRAYGWTRESFTLA
jgi:hypothetical protein